MTHDNNTVKPGIPPELADLARLQGLDPARYADAAALLDALAPRPEETAGPPGALEAVADTLAEACKKLRED